MSQKKRHPLLQDRHQTAPEDMTMEELDAQQRECAWLAVCYLRTNGQRSAPNVELATAYANRAAEVQKAGYDRMIAETDAKEKNAQEPTP